MLVSHKKIVLYLPSSFTQNKENSFNSVYCDVFVVLHNRRLSQDDGILAKVFFLPVYEPR